MHLPVGTFVLGTSLFFSLASAVPGHFCICTRPKDGNQDSSATARVCGEMPRSGGRAENVKFTGPGGGSFVGCVGLGFSAGARFGEACNKLYGNRVDKYSGAQCCTPDNCVDFHPVH
ncbi:hypothetical protein AC578_6000 [Pseudocercospora eumusae]|uniref:Uncharacterized protein n=1 Tax=Pseudocercospora eumusae TaxID=321146 RepID=A0A139HV97_9PEZI|nr:hypothetical protein AC578_6000 [Pseudocercospora eumusae]